MSINVACPVRAAYRDKALSSRIYSDHFGLLLALYTMESLRSPIPLIPFLPQGVISSAALRPHF